MPTSPSLAVAKRNRVALSATLERNLASYALAGAAGLGLGFAPPAQGAIEYTLVKFAGGPGSSIAIDLNHDGIVDFTINDFYVTTGFGGRNGSVLVQGANGNGVAVDQSSVAHAFSAGNVIGPKLTFAHQQYGMLLGGVLLTSSFGHGGGGEFLNQNNKFLGFKFSLNGETHYGWARVDVKSELFKMYFELVDYAYQTTPYTPIEAGQGIKQNQAASLGALAIGAEAIPLWRGATPNN